jgi:hypothetical protein
MATSTRRIGIGIADGAGTEGWQTVSSFSSYEDAQQAVDRLSDASFPVENAKIVGQDLELVERVLGRMTYARAAAAGAGGQRDFTSVRGLVAARYDLMVLDAEAERARRLLSAAQ